MAAAIELHRILAHRGRKRNSKEAGLDVYLQIESQQKLVQLTANGELVQECQKVHQELQVASYCADAAVLKLQQDEIAFRRIESLSRLIDDALTQPLSPQTNDMVMYFTGQIRDTIRLNRPFREQQ